MLFRVAMLTDGCEGKSSPAAAQLDGQRIDREMRSSRELPASAHDVAECRGW
jgi:hypothetical protein